jgi:hypothetical protein
VKGELLLTKIVGFPKNDNTDNVQHIYTEKYGTIYKLEHTLLTVFSFDEKNKTVNVIERIPISSNQCKGQLVLTPTQ